MKKSIIEHGPEKIILIISGSENKGKSESVKNIYNHFNNLPGKNIINDFKADNEEKGWEIKSIIEINGVRIGFESEGDPGSRLTLELLKDFFNHDCDLIICAARNGLTKPECRPLITILDEIRTNHPDYRIISTSNYEDLNAGNDPADAALCRQLNKLFSESAIKLIKHLFPALQQ